MRFLMERVLSVFDSSTLRRVVISATCLAVVGCSGGLNSVTASGTVTHKGSPVEGANVVFSRGAGDITKGEVAVGKTDAAGRFTLTTPTGPRQGGSGALPGDYTVTVTKHIPPKGMTMAQYQALVDAATKAGETGAMVPPERQPPPLVSMFAEHYSVQSKSKLKATIPPSGTSSLSFTLD